MRTPLVSPLRALAVVAFPLAIVGLGCSADPVPAAQVIPAPGQLMLALRTDMMPGKDFEELRVLITQDGVTNDSTSFTWTVTEGSVRGSVNLPTTVAVVRGAGTSGLTSIRVVAYRAGEASVVRDMTVAIPGAGVWLLPVRIEALCVNALSHGKKNELNSNCDHGSTCSAGRCVSTYVDSRALAAYRPEDVFGGGAAPGAAGSQCLDVLAAFSGAFDSVPRLEGENCVLSARDLVKPVVVDAGADDGGAADAGVDDAGAADASVADASVADASVADADAAGAADANVPDAGPEPSVQFTGNLALRGVSKSDGFCTSDLCLVPLPKGGAGGWSVQGPRIVLPRAVCDSPSPRVAVTLRGPSATEALPTCGEWSSAGDRTRTTAFSEPVQTNGSPCTRSNLLCVEHHTTCGNLWVRDDSCATTRVVNCGSCRGDRQSMLPVPAGSFLFGASSTEDGSADELPQTLTTVSAFWLDEFEVTAEAYAACIADGRCTLPLTNLTCNIGADGTPQAGRGNHPVNCVSWYQASAYCSWSGRRLPTEAEWEYVARGGNGGTRTRPWGEEAPSDHYLCWSQEEDSSRGQTCAVGSFPAGNSAQGFKDLAGNVWEWTSSPYSSDGHGVVGDPFVRVEKGASWATFVGWAKDIRNAYRGIDDMPYQSARVGMRCARDE